MGCHSPWGYYWESTPPIIPLKALVSTLVGNSGHYFFKTGSLVITAFNTLNVFVFFNLKVNGTLWCVRRTNGFCRWP